MLQNVNQVDNASKHGQELKVMVDKKCRGEFKTFGALCVNFCVLQMKREFIWDAK